MIDRILQLPEGVPPLHTYYVYLTGGCNLACQHCYLAPIYQADGGTGGHMDFDLLVLAVEEGLPLGLHGVKLTGGEPLLHPEFIRIVDFLKDQNLEITIETNGTLLTKEIAVHLREKNALRQISISLDGSTKEIHDAFRGVKGSFEKTCRGIHNLVEVGYRPQVIMSVHAGNAHDIETYVHFAESLGASSIKFNLVQPTGRGESMKKRGKLLEIQEVINLGNWVEKHLQKQVSMPLLFSWPLAFRSINRLRAGEGKCNIFNILGILSSGHLAMCGVGTHVPELCYGMLGKDSVRDVWINNTRLLELRKKLPQELEGVCSQCLFKGNCMGYCVADNYSSTKSLSAAFWFCQSAYELGLFPESRIRDKMI